MNQLQAAFVERMGQFLGSVGMTPLAGRMWGWLLVCDPSEQTAEEVATALQASRASISPTARLLTQLGMIRRSSRRGDRREYFSAPPGTFRALLASLAAYYRTLGEICDVGVAALDDRPAASRERIEEIKDWVQFFQGELPLLVERFETERRARSPGEG
jgi:DNA-binding transcriptional regulator GbsR (MarR family)